HSHEPASATSEEGLGRAHMETTCSAGVSPEFDRALALLHNFWYVRARERFNQVVARDPQCAMGYWGAAMTYNHLCVSKIQNLSEWWRPPRGYRDGNRCRNDHLGLGKCSRTGAVLESGRTPP